jgi:hypothetical protein
MEMDAISESRVMLIGLKVLDLMDSVILSIILFASRGQTLSFYNHRYYFHALDLIGPLLHVGLSFFEVVSNNIKAQWAASKNLNRPCLSREAQERELTLNRKSNYSDHVDDDIRY